MFNANLIVLISDKFSFKSMQMLTGDIRQPKPRKLYPNQHIPDVRQAEFWQKANHQHRMIDFREDEHRTATAAQLLFTTMLHLPRQIP